MPATFSAFDFLTFVVYDYYDNIISNVAAIHSLCEIQISWSSKSVHILLL
jgi:hypothetical protein